MMGVSSFILGPRDESLMGLLLGYIKGQGTDYLSSSPQRINILHLPHHLLGSRKLFQLHAVWLVTGGGVGSNQKGS